MSLSLKDYPTYDPPHRQGPNYLRHLRGKSDHEYHLLLAEFAERGRENFSYFMEHRDKRIAALRTFLRSSRCNLDLTTLDLRRCRLGVRKLWCTCR